MDQRSVLVFHSLATISPSEEIDLAADETVYTVVGENRAQSGKRSSPSRQSTRHLGELAEYLVIWSLLNE